MSDKKKMFINIVLDESGSMGTCLTETVDGFNEYLKSQQKQEDVEVFMSLTKFNTEVNILCTASPAADVQPLTAQTYSPGGMTALYDAIAQSIQSLETSMQREKEGTGVLFVVFTDGHENSSKEYAGPDGLKRLADLIEKKKKKDNWTFVFFGADIDAWGASAGLNITTRNVMSLKKCKMGQAYRGLAASTGHFAKNLAEGVVGSSADFFSNNIADYDGINEDDADSDAADKGLHNPLRGMDARSSGWPSVRKPNQGDWSNSPVEENPPSSED